VVPKCGPQTNNINITWKLRNCKFLSSILNPMNEKLGGERPTSVFLQAFYRILTYRILPCMNSLAY
jgi:hypothetical protein